MRVVRRVPARIISTLACCAGLSSCGETLAPATVRGLFVREQPPAAMVIGEATVRVIADTFVLGNDHRGVRRVVLERLPAGAATPVLEHAQYAFDYRLEDGAVGFQYSPDCTERPCAAIGSREWYNLWPSGQAMASRTDRAALYTRRGPQAP